MMNVNVAAIINKTLLTQWWGRPCWCTQEKGNRGRKESGEEWPPAADNKASEHFCGCESISPVFPSVWRNRGLDWTHQVMLAFVKKKNHILLFLLGGGGLSDHRIWSRIQVHHTTDPSLSEAKLSQSFGINPSARPVSFFPHTHTHAAFWQGKTMQL